MSYWYFDNKARQNSLRIAQQVCTSIKAGMSVEDIIEVARQNGGIIRSINDRGAIAGASGYGMCRCSVELENKVVLGARKAWCQH